MTDEKPTEQPEDAPDIMNDDRAPDTRLDLSVVLHRYPKFAVFVAQLTLCRGNASEAARKVGWSADYGRKLVMRYPELREAAQVAIAAEAENTILAWRDLHQKAIRKINRLMESADEAIALRAAEVAIERNEGRPVQRHRIEDDEAYSPESVFFRFVMALVMSQGLELTAAMQYAHEHPEQVADWGARVLGAGQPKEMSEE